MKALLLPVILLLLGVGSGVGAGLFLMPEPEDPMVATDCADPNEMTQAALPTTVDVTTEREFAKLNNQFIIPVVEEGMVSALVVMSLNLEVTVGSRPAIFTAEPKLRDRFLQVMFDHANTGGFSGNFTSGTNMGVLRSDLLRAAKDISGERVTDVLVIDIVRQDT
jgi:hypothetical protein